MNEWTAILTLFGGVVGATLQYWFSRSAEARKQLQLLQSQSYVDYLRAVTKATYARSPDAARAAKTEAVDAKAGMAVYAASRVITALARFEEVGAILDGPPAHAVFVAPVCASRTREAFSFLGTCLVAHGEIYAFAYCQGPRIPLSIQFHRRPPLPHSPHRQPSPFLFLSRSKEAQTRSAESLAKDLDTFFSGDYLSACDLSTALSRLIPAVVRGDIKPRLARTVAYMFQTQLQPIHLSQHEYISAFGTDGWRKAVRTSVNVNYDYRFPSAPDNAKPKPQQPEPPQSQRTHPQRQQPASSSPQRPSRPPPPAAAKPQPPRVEKSCVASQAVLKLKGLMP
ncbi:MAG TPA: hypothetical protein VIX91_03215 [Candidatus Acidoferrum sp.]